MNSNTRTAKGNLDLREALKKNAKSDTTEIRRLMDLYIEGISAEAKLIKIEEAGTFAGRFYCKMTIEVIPSDTKKFKVTGFAPVSGSLIPRAGDTLNIKYNPSDTEKFVII